MFTGVPKVFIASHRDLVGNTLFQLFQKKAELSIKNIRDNFFGAEPGRKENMAKSWRLVVESV